MKPNLRCPILLELFRFKKQDNKRNCDFFCTNCGIIRADAKLERMIRHAKECGFDQELIDTLIEQESVWNYVRSHGKRESTESETAYKRRVDDLIVMLIAVNSLPLRIKASNELKELLQNVAVARYKPP